MERFFDSMGWFPLPASKSLLVFLNSRMLYLGAMRVNNPLPALVAKQLEVA